MIRCLHLAPVLLVALTGAVSAQALPDWLPEAIALPEPHEIVRDTEIGSAIRMLAVEIPGDAAPLMDEWRAALAEAGYQVEDASESTNGSQIVFSGDGIQTGQIVLMPGADDEASVIQIDATLED